MEEVRYLCYYTIYSCQPLSTSLVWWNPKYVLCLSSHHRCLSRIKINQSYSARYTTHYYGVIHLLIHLLLHVYNFVENNNKKRWKVNSQQLSSLFLITEFYVCAETIPKQKNLMWCLSKCIVRPNVNYQKEEVTCSCLILSTIHNKHDERKDSSSAVIEKMYLISVSQVMSKWNSVTHKTKQQNVHVLQSPRDITWRKQNENREGESRLNIK